jgi:hypothetical protein
MTTQDKSERAVAYYRSTVAEGDGVESEDVRRWAETHGIEIVREFEDTGTSELRSELQFNRLLVAPCCTMGDKIRRAHMLAAEKGYWTGGNPPYGLRRLLLDGKGNPLHLLEPGERKTIRNHRVALVAGEPVEVTAVHRIFHEFVDLGYSKARIAKGLNAQQIPSLNGGPWNAG